MEDVGAWKGLQPAVPLAYGLSAQTAVELSLLHTLVEAHYVCTQLLLQPLAAVDALAQAVQLELAQLGPAGTGERREQDQVRTGKPPPRPAQEALSKGTTMQSGPMGSGPGCILALLMGLGKTSCPLWAFVCPQAERMSRWMR